MNNKFRNRLFYFILPVISFLVIFDIAKANAPESVHIWEKYDIILKADKKYKNYYTDVICWVDLKGPEFSKRIYGFWDGDNTYKVRIVATKPGNWQWISGSNQADDNGLNHKQGVLQAGNWTKEEQIQNPNRRGFVRSSTNGHSLQYADGTPFFMIGDTWLAGTTWRLPFRNAPTSNNYKPGPGIGFEDAVNYRKNQGFNSVSMISCFPNWEADENPATYADTNGIFVRNAWEKFDYLVKKDEMTSKDMRDEYGNEPFKMSKKHKGIADFDNINTEYFKSLDNKMQFLSDKGFVPLLETIRRDMCPTWKAYFDFNESYSRFVQYLISRYGAYNIIFSGIHLDWIPKEYSLTADEFNEALTYHLKKYGPLPFGQLHTTLINNSTYTQFGHGTQCPWLTMHSVGNRPRDHSVMYALETLFNLNPAYPAINFEPYYTGWNHEINKPNGERPPVNSARDNYFSRAQMYGSVLSGGLSGHVHGTAAYDITSTGEPAGLRPHFWDALNYESGVYMQYLGKFILSEGNKYQDLKICYKDINPQKAPGSPEEGLDGWSYMMRTPDKEFALLYFENQSVLPKLTGFAPDIIYTLQWYNPVTGEWYKPITVQADKSGIIILPFFPDKLNPANSDWAAKIIRKL